ncbi:DUF2608 domain-containing protein, partial [Bacteriovoracaceae bacterium]|nr:DUF2608 domain-containing protein [Bacteriovoracaceae bacterium]
IDKVLKEKVSKYGPKQVLLVVDIDNTILKMNQNIGSDQWFSWQAKIMRNKDCQPACVTKSFTELLKIQGWLFSFSPMVSPEKQTPQIISQAQSKGVKVIALTSRGPEFFSPTMRELKRNKYDFTKSHFGSSIPGFFKPYNKENYKIFGLNDDDFKKNKGEKVRNALYQEGVFMTSGMNKGVMLKYLMGRFNKKYSAIIFVDDHEKHMIRMNDILGNHPDLTTFRYSNVDPQVKKFKDSDKKVEITAWTKINKVFTEVFAQ